MKTVLFRVESSAVIGLGHLMRCLTLADELRTRGAVCHFLCRAPQGGLIVRKGHGLHVLTDDTAETVCRIAVDLAADWIVVDHYGLDHMWERAACPADTQLMVIDDLADRAHGCAILLDQNLGRIDADYDGLIGADTWALLGPHYALLRPEFAQARADSLSRRASGQVKRVLLNFGGADPMDVSAKAMRQILQDGPAGLEYTLVLGGAAAQKPETTALARDLGVRVLSNVRNMSDLMAQADVVIGAGGATAWERCCLGVPSAIVIVAENQRGSVDALVSAGACALAGDLTRGDDLTGTSEFLRRCVKDADYALEISRKSADLVDGLGAARVADVMEITAS